MESVLSPRPSKSSLQCVSSGSVFFGVRGRMAKRNWLGAAIDTTKILAAAGKCLPLGVVAPLFDSAVVLLEAIEVVQRNTQELKELVDDVVSLMTLILSEVKAHGESHFEAQCRSLHNYLQQILAQIQPHFGKRGFSGWVFRCLEAHNIREEIAAYRRGICAMRANLTLKAALEARTHLQGVERTMCVVQCALTRVEREVSSIAALVPECGCRGISPACDEDFPSIMPGDVVLMGPIGVPTLRQEDGTSSRQVVTWADYRASVRGGVEVVQMYSGPMAQETYIEDLAVFRRLQHYSLLQLHATSPSKLRPSLVFHGNLVLLDIFTSRQSPLERVESKCKLIEDYQQGLQFLVAETNFQGCPDRMRTLHQSPLSINLVTRRVCLVPVLHKSGGGAYYKHTATNPEGIFRAWRHDDYTLSTLHFDVPWSTSTPQAIPALHPPPQTRTAITSLELVGLDSTSVSVSLTQGPVSPPMRRDYITALVALQRPAVPILWYASSSCLGARDPDNIAHPDGLSDIPRLGGVYCPYEFTVLETSKKREYKKSSPNQRFAPSELCELARVSLPFTPAEMLSVSSADDAVSEVLVLDSGWTRFTLHDSTFDSCNRPIPRTYELEAVTPFLNLWPSSLAFGWLAQADRVIMRAKVPRVAYVALTQVTGVRATVSWSLQPESEDPSTSISGVAPEPILYYVFLENLAVDASTGQVVVPRVYASRDPNAPNPHAGVESDLNLSRTTDLDPTNLDLTDDFNFNLTLEFHADGWSAHQYEALQALLLRRDGGCGSDVAAAFGYPSIFDG